MSLARSNASNLQKRSSQALLSPNAAFSNASPSIHALPEAAGSVARLLQVQAGELRRISSRVQMRNKRGVLLETEERIFGEVLVLLEQIDDLRTNILSAREDIRELQVSHPHVEEQVRFHGYGQRLTQQQCSDLEEENTELVRQIEQVDARQVNSLEEVLRIQRGKYQELKGELTESGSPQQLEKKAQQLRDSIAELEHSREAKVKAQFPEFDQIKLRNEELRQKTLTHLRNDANLEAQQLREYLRSDEEDRAEFMEELKKFKGEYNRLKVENQTLGERLVRREESDAKENSNLQGRSKAASSKWLQVESKLKRSSGGGDRVEKLREYQSHIRMMQNRQG